VERYEVFLIGGNDDEAATFTTIEDGNTCRLICEYRGKALTAESSDFFEALCEIRNELEKERLIPFCYGASLNVFPSGMARDMGAGLKAYKMEIGTPARSAELVEIFNEGADVIPCFVAVQREFF
jgi:hypothetical protein